MHACRQTAIYTVMNLTCAHLHADRQFYLMADWLTERKIEK